MAVDIVWLVMVADRLAAAAGQSFAAAGSVEGLAAATTWLAGEVERELAGKEPVRVACGPGCSACCVVNVSVLVPEAVAIAIFLRKNSADLSQMRERLGLFADRVRWMDDIERPKFRLPCAFLDTQGCCIVHPVRPILCRSVSSTDAGACRNALEEGRSVVMNLPQRILCTLLFTSLGTVLQDHGMDCRSLELSRMVVNLLDRPALGEEFLSRKRVDFA